MTFAPSVGLGALRQLVAGCVIQQEYRVRSTYNIKSSRIASIVCRGPDRCLEECLAVLVCTSGGLLHGQFQVACSIDKYSRKAQTVLVHVM